MIKYETNSKLVKNGQTFVAIKGNTVDGHDYIDEAIKNGASKVIGEKDLKLNIPYLKVKNTEKYLIDHIAKYYSDDIKDLKIIGITGTNGKTTSCYLIYQMLKLLGKNVCYIGTLGYYHNDEYKSLNNTTPDTVTLYNLLIDAKKNNIEYVVMEISSHSLATKRIKGIHLIAAGFTNLTPDHLDFHKDMPNYLKAKLKILNYLDNDKTILLNSDDRAHEKFKKHKFETYGMNGDYKIENYEILPHQTNLTFTYKHKKYHVTTNLTSKFNIYNYLNAIGILHSIGFKISDLIKITQDIYPPKGRCETYQIHHAYAVIDYAHTPDAVEKVIKAYKELAKKKIYTIIGCGGDRDRFKRPLMGNIATSLSDYVIFTNDNPRCEDEKQIINDIIKDNHYNNYEIIYDRENAINKGLSLLNTDDILLILGKGHENYQIIGHTKYHLDDAEIVKNYINKNTFNY